MTAWAYTIVRNELVLMPYWLRHYGAFCERLVVYDDASDDGTPDIVRAWGAELRTFPSSGAFDDTDMVTLANATYPEARGHADWVIWVDADELIYHPSVTARLSQLTQQGVTLPTINGYCMMADNLPSDPDAQLTDQVRTGIRVSRYDKPCVVDPQINIEWYAGRHEFNASGSVAGGADDPLKLLHYRWLAASIASSAARATFGG